MSAVSVIIPTFRRPEGLQRAVESLQQQKDAPRFEVVIVDNSPEASAHATSAMLQSKSEFAIRYIHEPNPGVANARNAGLAAAHYELIAFLDDDEEATSCWLAALVTTQARLSASVVFGPIEAVLPHSAHRHRSYFEAFFARRGPTADGWLDHAFGCGNSLMVRADALRGKTPFHADQNETGGEDDRLFHELSERGVRFAWSASALCMEHVPPARARLSYTLRRAFAYGQSPSQIAAHTDPPQWLALARWMAIGAGQAAVFGLAGLAIWLASPKRAISLLDRAVRGAGKVFWAPIFVPKFYGAYLARTGLGRDSADRIR